MDFLISMLQQGLSFIGPFFLLLGLLIFVHELGHFLVAKFFNVRVETFSLGFGKKFIEFTRGDTTYCVSLIPLGGYVKMYGDDPSVEVPESEKNRAFLHKPVGQRIAIVLAGPLMNLFFAGVIFMGILMIGHKVPAPVIGDIQQDSKAHQQGFRSGDEILEINGTAIAYWEEARLKIREQIDQPLKFKVKRETTGETTEFSVQPELVDNDDVFSLNPKVGGVPGLKLLSKAPLVGIYDAKSPAAKAGFRSLDLIKKINGEEIRYWRDIEKRLKALPPNVSLEFEVEEFSYDPKAEKNPRTITVDQFSWDGRNDVYKSIGFETTELYLADVKKDSPASRAGLQKGDRIARLDNKDINQWENVLESVKGWDKTKGPLTFGILRNGETLELKIEPEMTQLMNRKLQEEERFTVGIMPAFTGVVAPAVIQQSSSPLKVLNYGVERSIHWTKLVCLSLIKLVRNEMSSRNIAGVITIGRVANQSFSVGITAFMKIMAIISINLFLLNLLPIPILDGGHLLFFTIEAIRGAPLSMRKMEIAQQLGLIIMMTLMVFALFNDIRNIFSSPW